MSDDNRIYTRTGDAGTTALFGGGRVRKDDIRVDAYGEVDELNACIGFTLSMTEDEWLVPKLRMIQSDLFAIGAHLATPVPSGNRRQPSLPGMPLDRVAEMESWMDDASARLEPLRAFILPGGSASASALHLARTVCRRAERRVITLESNETIRPEILTYLNRLSDFLFIAARRANSVAGIGDTPWIP
jgi:cob(I)alamin adenosyltransferase